MLIGTSVYRAVVNRIENGLIMLAAQSSKRRGLMPPNGFETNISLAALCFQLRHDHVAVAAELVEDICILDRMRTNGCQRAGLRRLKTSLGR